MPLWAFWEQPLLGPAPHFTCATNNPDYIFLWHSKPAPDDRWSSSKALQLARVRCNCLSQQHAQLRRLLLSFPKRKLRRQVCTNCVIHETYVSQRLTNLCFVQILSVTHPPHLRSRCRPLTSVSFNYAPSRPPFMLPLRIVFDIYIIQLRMWRDGSRRFVWVGGSVWALQIPLHSVRFGQMLVTLCTSTHCQCNESVHRKEQLLFIRLWLSRVTRDHEWTNG